MLIEKHWGFLFILFGYASPESCGRNVTDYGNEFVKDGDRKEISVVVGENYTSSATWRFETTSGKNFTLTIDRVQNGLREADCINGGPYVEVGGSSIPLKGCVSRLSAIINPIVTSNVVEIRHCRGVDGTPFKFTVEASLAGVIYVRKKTQSFFVDSNKISRDQWILFQKIENLDYIMRVRLDVNSMRLSDKGNCGKGYITIKDASDHILVEECNKGENFTKNIIQDISDSTVNVTFKRAMFSITVDLLPPTALSQNSGNMTSGNIERPVIGLHSSNSNSPTTTQSNSREANHSEHDDHSSLLLYIGLALAIAVVIGLVVFAFSIVRHRKYQQAKRQLRKQSQTTALTAYSSAAAEEPPQEKDFHSLSNAMYGQVVGGGNSTSKPSTSQVQNRRLQSAGSDNEVLDKRQVRLSQLAEKYIDVDFALTQRSRNERERNHLDSHARSIPEFGPPENEPCNPEATFNRTRPPMPPPVQNKVSNKYEVIDSPLTERDLVTPAYATVDENMHRVFQPRFENTASCTDPTPSSSLSECNYSIPTKHGAGGLSVAQYSSSELISVPETLEENVHNSSISDGSEKSTSSNFKEDCHGYLSVLDSEKHKQGSSGKYVAPNQLSIENPGKHFQQPVPRSKINFTTTSMPSLLDDEKSGSLKDPPPKPPRKGRSSGAGRFQESFSSRPFTSNQYQSPRPSAPEIFVKSAYTSTDDIDRIRLRLQRLHDDAMGNAESDTKLSLPDESLLYASPRSSPASSITSLPGQQTQGYYATPRPSLPHLFPEEMKPFVANDNVGTPQEM